MSGSNDLLVMFEAQHTHQCGLQFLALGLALVLVFGAIVERFLQQYQVTTEFQLRENQTA